MCFSDSIFSIYILCLTFHKPFAKHRDTNVSKTNMQPKQKKLSGQPTLNE